MKTSIRHIIKAGLVALSAMPLAAAAQQKVQLPARDKILTDRPPQLYAIGAEEGEDWELLSGVRGVAFDARDNLYVLDGGNYRVLVFDANGGFVRKISKQGGGPGELQAPIGMTVTTDGTIVVSDIGRGAYSLFKADGAFIKNVMFDEEGVPGLGSGSLQPHPRGGVIARINPLPMFGRGGSDGPPQINRGPTGERKSPVKWWDLGTGKATQLYEFTLPSITPRVRESGGGSGQTSRVSVMLSAPMWQPDVSYGILPGGGIAFANEKEYRIKVANVTGQIERIIERPIAPKKGTEKDKEMALEQQRARFSNAASMVSVSRSAGGTRISTAPPRGNDNTPSLDEQKRNTTFEEFIPVFRQISTDPQGRIWIARTPPDFATRGLVDIVRIDGTYIGTLTSGILPGAVSKSGRAAYVERDDLGVEHVVVKRLPASWQ